MSARANIRKQTGGIEVKDLIETLPVVALRGMTILPDMVIHFDVSRERSVKAIEQAMLREQRIFLVTQKDVQVEQPGPDDLYRIGTIAAVKQVIKLPHNVIRVLAEGLERAELSHFSQEGDFLEAEIIRFEEDNELEELAPGMRDAMVRNLTETFHLYCKESGKVGKELERQITESVDLAKLMSQIMINLPLYYEEKQKLLEAVSLSERYELLCVQMNKEIEVMRFKRELQEKVKARVDKNQREYLLREQLKVIREELGEDTSGSDADHFREELKKLKASKEVKEKIEKEITRFKNIGNNSSESAVIRGYIETLLELPWDKASKDSTDLKRAEEILDEDHYGMEKVKQRVLEFLAVRILTKKGRSPIICLVGPPGTGKTSIARSIARALNKKYVRISLGGVHDEAEIRGHRKTYVGAMPGRIAEGIRHAGVRNPLMLLDEIDKVSSDYKGDTASALLEVLDGEQNVNFRDHYLEVPLDLSEVLFICTANEPERISKPLLDRMEIIELSSYTENEKFHIAKQYLIRKQRKANGIQKKQISMPDEVIYEIIRSYTREAGVRDLERKIGRIMRKAARAILEGQDCLNVRVEDLADLLGMAPYSEEEKATKPQVGIVRGLAWTSVGGDTLSIEVNVMPGKGKLALTGRMGDVMKESAQIGLSYIRSIARQYDIDEEFFEKHDIHIHIPEGAVPKDGPSAGITMTTAMLSAIIGRKVRGDLAMTGEITLRGRVLPIGGLKEKLLAAKAAGMKEVLVPDKNRRNIRELDKEITEGLTITFVEDMSEVLEKAFVK